MASDQDDIELSIVAPVYRGGSSIGQFIARVRASVEKISEQFEIIIVEDGSPDGSWNEICAASAQDPRVRGIRLSRNFGQHPAITAGMDRVRGRWVVVMDSDLQDRPEDIALLYDAVLRDGLDIVIARRAEKGASGARRLSSLIFNWTLSRLGGIDVDHRVGNFRIFSRHVAGAYREFREQFRMFPAIMARVGFKVGFVDVDRDHRAEGRSTYTWRALVRLAADAIVANSEKPLWFAIYFGGFASVLAFFLSVWTIGKALFDGSSVSGWSSIFFAISFFAGVQILCTGILGIYVGRVFNETKKRPIYIVAESTS